MLLGFIFIRDLRNASSEPLLGGSMITTSAFLFRAYSTRKSPASPSKNLIFFILLICALTCASSTAFGLSSMPITFPAYFAAVIPIVPIPQYASTTVSFLFIPAAFIAAL